MSTDVPTEQNIKWSSIEIILRGTTHLICNNWKTKDGKEIEARTNPEIFGQQSADEQFANALYMVEGREDWDSFRAGKYGMPAYFVRMACVAVAKSSKEWELARILRAYFFTDDVIAPITEMTPRPRKDTVRAYFHNQGTKPVTKWRAQFDEGWEMKVPARLDEGKISIARLAVTLHRAGSEIGIGEWRPEKRGRLGKFDVLEVSKIDT